MNSLTLTMALLMGLAGSLHCAGMCGPIMFVLPFQNLHGVKKWAAIFLYHFGRAGVYALLALLLSSFKGLFSPQIQQYISVFLGGVLLLVGLISFFPSQKIRFKLPWTEFVRRQLGDFMFKPNLIKMFFTGALNGLLPCGLVYMALAASLSAGSPLQSIVFMFAFGIGTMPVLVLLIVLKNKFVLFRSRQFSKFVPAIMLAFGLLFVFRGMNLGIPYLSPKIYVEQQTINTSCCHKK